jgi:hypothetical protein
MPEMCARLDTSHSNATQRLARAVGILVLSLGSVSSAAAQGFDLTLFVGRAYPIYDELLSLAPPIPNVPGADVTVVGSPLLEADGGPVFGGALAFEWGIFGIEGRLDATDVALKLTGARYELRGTEPPFTGATASVTVSDGKYDANRIMLLSGNARLRTPGPIGLVVSGGVSFLPDLSISGTVPIRIEVPGFPIPADLNPTLTLRAVPGQSDHRWGINGGAGLRVGGRVALMGEVRAFYFPEHELRFDVENDLGLLDSLLLRLDPVRFEPVFVNAQVGVVFKF